MTEHATVRTTTVGGAVVTLAGVAALLPVLDLARSEPIAFAPWILLAAGCAVLALGLGGVGIAGRSTVGRTALLMTGVVPLLSWAIPPSTPWSVVLGMTVIVLAAVAPVVAAVRIARSGAVEGVARWSMIPVAANALLILVMSSVGTEALATAYFVLHLELLLPVALLVWGVSTALQGHGPALRARAARVLDGWRATTDVGHG